MEIGNLIQSRLMGKSAALLSRALDYRSANHNVISGNSPMWTRPAINRRSSDSTRSSAVPWTGKGSP